jgi:hypothetical protein
MSRGRLVATDQSSGRRSPMKEAATRFERKPARSGASWSPWIDGASRGRKWGRRRGAPVLARGKRVKRGTTSGNAFLWRLGGVAGKKRAGGPAWCHVCAGEVAEREGLGCGAT